MIPFYTNGTVDLYHGDCHEVLPSLEGGFAACVTDPPFGINYQNNYTGTVLDVLAGDAGPFSYAAWSRLVFDLLKDDSAVFAYTGWSEYPRHYVELGAAGFGMREPLIVQKRPSGKTDLYGTFQTNTDWLLFGHKGRFKFKATRLVRNKRAGTIPNPGRSPVPEFKTRFPSAWLGSPYPYSTENPNAAKHLGHPTVKTVELMRWLILLSTDPGETVLDPFAGSGTTLVAATMSGRRAVGIEADERFVELAARRLETTYPNPYRAALVSPTPDPTEACECVGYTIRTDYGTGTEHDVDRSSCPTHGDPTTP